MKLENKNLEIRSGFAAVHCELNNHHHMKAFREGVAFIPLQSEVAGS